MRAILVAVVLLLPAAAHASGNEVKVPFLFTDDQAVPQTDLAKDMTPSDVLRTDAFLKAPMTRLEYMLTRMETALNSETTVAALKDVMRERFERPRRPLNEESVRGFAGYSDRSGRVLVGYAIEGMGRPRRPMRDACQEVLNWVGRKLPHENMLYLLHNTLLGVLGQKDHHAYTPMLGKLAAQFVHRVHISSETEEGKVHHTIACQRTRKDGPVSYDKFSFRLK
jgi:hypothetical protein